ncbi:large ribosomal subunit protein mL46-like [Rhopilema esculentum]|uniref:large ribosomal subunit protein mL46-like n=1 Tax=Rhopilema esculentum TaxID=499914 RepID=UPI0031D623D1
MAEVTGLAVKRTLFGRWASNALLKGVQRSFGTLSQVSPRTVPFYRKPWKVCVAVLLERKPIISKQLTDIEQRFATYQNVLELEQSVLSDHELRKLRLTKGSKATKKKKTTEAEEQKRLECEQELRRIEDEEEEVTEEVESLQLGSQKTDADKKHDKSSLLRCLDKSLHLVVRDSDKWLLPETEIKEDENLRQAAERLISSQSSSEVPVLVLSNAPSGVYTEEIESEKREESDIQGRKIFYYKAILQPMRNVFPEFDKPSNWLTIKEMQDLMPREHFKQIIKFSS